MRWYVALMYNFLSAVSAIIGMFIGVAIGTAQEDATAWILAITAGVFLYVSLVDLVTYNYFFNGLRILFILDAVTAEGAR